ncbi:MULTISPECIES: glutathione S-transferase family protein [unclassified Ruegeria]|uniref:glutathione S-transferase family protein n=1 Tax=unclassified Ruegeria TaxID=2625375 RepID=UPI0014916826|nr:MULTISPECIES: glutathione S-transferase family protein [unclassified Ruegeria]NOC47218.1 glutathione S-transferase family protein [Ruegeria sp. HKCCD7559]
MLTLLTYPSAFGLFSASPFCVKTALMLQHSGQVWQRSDMLDPRRMPHQKLPVLRTPERLIPDSDLIRDWLERKGAEFDQGLSDVEKAQSRALVRMAEEHLYFHIVLDRWGNDEVWPILRETFFTGIPTLIRKPASNAIRKSVLKGIRSQGIGRFSLPERLDRVERDLEAISAHLWQSRFLLADQPTSADMSVGPMLAAMRATPADTPLTRRIKQDNLLNSYVDRMEQAIPIA